MSLFSKIVLSIIKEQSWFWFDEFFTILNCRNYWPDAEVCEISDSLEVTGLENMLHVYLQHNNEWAFSCIKITSWLPYLESGLFSLNASFKQVNFILFHCELILYPIPVIHNKAFSLKYPNLRKTFFNLGWNVKGCPGSGCNFLHFGFL